jgi:hypothetical protein
MITSSPTSQISKLYIYAEMVIRKKETHIFRHFEFFVFSPPTKFTQKKMGLDHAQIVG